jgi:RNA polymerase sigma-70 factor (ECF subfamily)
VSSASTGGQVSAASPIVAGGVVVRGDAEAIRRAVDGDRAAFGEVALAWQDRIYNALRKVTGNEHDAADLTQETFAKAIGHLSSFRGESSAYTWLFRIAMNLAMTRGRQIKRRRTVTAGQMDHKAGREDQAQDGVFERRAAGGDMPQDAVQKKERDEQVMAALGRLPEEQRSLLVLRDVEGMEYQQMAEVLSVPLGTLKSRLFRARVALREQLKDYFEAYEVA